MKIAALDLGSNSFLCLIAEGDSSGIKKVLQDVSRIVKLGQELEKNGELHPEALARARLALSDFKKVINQHSPDRIQAVATAAVREAKNKQVFFDLLAEFDIPVQILSGPEEADISFKGAFSDKSAVITGNQILIDIGGGSTEIVWGQNGGIKWAQSFPIGVVKLTERFIHQQPFDISKSVQINKFLDQIFDEQLSALHQKVEDPTLCAVGGTATTLAGVILGGYDPVKVDGFNLTKEHFEKWIKLFASTSIEEKKDKYQVGPRAEVILAGCFLLEYLRKYFGRDQVKVSIRGVRYGLALQLLKHPGS
ncbi:MAG: Ppx/GppA family phosphatase [Bdellovibrionota bacterium]